VSGGQDALICCLEATGEISCTPRCGSCFGGKGSSPDHASFVLRYLSLVVSLRPERGKGGQGGAAFGYVLGCVPKDAVTIVINSTAT
jgi:hypothetical protein